MSQIMIPYVSLSLPHHEKTIISVLENFTSKRGKAKTKQNKPPKPQTLNCPCYEKLGYHSLIIFSMLSFLEMMKPKRLRLICSSRKSTFSLYVNPILKHFTGSSKSILNCGFSAPRQVWGSGLWTHKKKDAPAARTLFLHWARAPPACANSALPPPGAETLPNSRWTAFPQGDCARLPQPQTFPLQVLVLL